MTRSHPIGFGFLPLLVRLARLSAPLAIAGLGAFAAEPLDSYPSALLPPVWEPYVFPWFALHDPGLWTRVPTANVDTWSRVGSGQASRGILYLRWAAKPERFDSQEAWTDYLIALSSDWAGYTLDEGAYREDNPNAQLVLRAVREAKRTHPAPFASVFWRGEEMLAQLAAEGALDLLILEGYTHVHRNIRREWGISLEGIKRRLDTARKAGALERTVVMLGHICKPEDYHEGYVLTTEILDQEIAELRAYAPEMPGVGFYFQGGEELAEACDRLARKHFIEPAPDLLITEPAVGAELTGDTVTLRAQATPSEGRTIREYKWFIDNCLVARTSEPTYVWDLQSASAGHHIITVHAVDSGYNRAAAQVLVTVSRSGDTTARE